MSNVRSKAAIICLAVIATPIAGERLHAAPVSSGLQLWLDAADANTVRDASNKNPTDVGFTGDVQTWQDKSGNGNNATPTNAGQNPVYSAGASNGQAAITFNSANTSSAVNNTTQAFSLNSNIVTPRETMFFSLKMFDNGDNRGIWAGATGNQFTNDNNRYFISVANQNGILNSAPATNAPQTYAVVTETRDPASTTNGQATVYRDGTTVGTVTGTAGDPMTLSMTVNRIGTIGNGRYFYGQMSEILIYNATLNTAQRAITENYLSSKYGSTLTGSDHYVGDTSANGEHDFDVFGIGQDIATTLSPAGKLSSSIGDAIALTELNSSLADGEYVLAGHDTTAHGFTTADLPPGAISRWARDYFLDVTGTVDTRLQFDFALAGLGTPSASGYSLLYRSGPSGTFSDLGIAGVVSGSTVSFDLLGLTNSSDGFYTIAAVPEPASFALLGVGMSLFASRRFTGRRVNMHRE